MSRKFLSIIVHALRFTPNGDEAAARASSTDEALFSLSVREWTRYIGVLDRTGLTLPLYARLLESGVCARLPKQIVVALERRRRDNTIRMRGMLDTFEQAATALQHADVKFLCVKGFSLFPDFLSEPWQRHQIDLDLLITSGDGVRAQKALEQLGYKLAALTEDGERRMRIPTKKHLGHDWYVYSPQEGPAVELHSQFFEADAEGLSVRCPEDFFEQSTMHTIGTVSFARLSRPHAFLYQILHVFRHFLASWARLLWLYEIAAFLQQHRDNDALWHEIRVLCSADQRLAEATALVLLTAQNLFACTIPPALEGICILPTGSPMSLWISHYARRWLLTDMPGNKLNLLLQRHFFLDDRVWRRYLAVRLAPRGKRPTLCEGIEDNAARSLAYRLANLRFRLVRVRHHLSTGVEFALASIVWELKLRANRLALSPGHSSRRQS